MDYHCSITKDYRQTSEYRNYTGCNISKIVRFDNIKELEEKIIWTEFYQLDKETKEIIKFNNQSKFNSTDRKTRTYIFIDKDYIIDIDVLEL